MPGNKTLLIDAGIEIIRGWNQLHLTENPTGLLFLKLPVNFLPLLQVYVPQPLILPLTISPSYLLPLGEVMVPLPCNLPFLIGPSNLFPLASV